MLTHRWTDPRHICETASFPNCHNECDKLKSEQPNCNKSGLEPISTSIDIAIETTIRNHPSLPSIIPNVDGSYFTYPDGPATYDANDSVDVLWVTDATDYSIHLNCTLRASGIHNSTEVLGSQAINNGSRHSSSFLFPLDEVLNVSPRWLTISCALAKKGYLIDGVQYKLPNQSAICIMVMLDGDGNYLAESAYFNIRDAVKAVHSAITWGTLPTASATLYSTVTLLPSKSINTVTMTATSNATSTTSSSISLSTTAPSLTAHSKATTSMKLTTVSNTVAVTASRSGSNPDARGQSVMGILAGAVALVLFQ